MQSWHHRHHTRGLKAKTNTTMRRRSHNKINKPSHDTYQISLTTRHSPIFTQKRATWISNTYNDPRYLCAVKSLKTKSSVIISKEKGSKADGLHSSIQSSLTLLFPLRTTGTTYTLYPVNKITIHDALRNSVHLPDPQPLPHLHLPI